MQAAGDTHPVEATAPGKRTLSWLLYLVCLFETGVIILILMLMVGGSNVTQIRSHGGGFVVMGSDFAIIEVR